MKIHITHNHGLAAAGLIWGVLILIIGGIIVWRIVSACQLPPRPPCDAKLIGWTIVPDGFELPERYEQPVAMPACHQERLPDLSAYMIAMSLDGGAWESVRAFGEAFTNAWASFRITASGVDIRQSEFCRTNYGSVFFRVSK